MHIYTGKGDNGRTGLREKGPGVLKTDERIELLGTIDELNSSLGLVKVIAGEDLKKKLVKIQKLLLVMGKGVADTFDRELRITERNVEMLEDWINDLEEALPEEKIDALPGGCELSARLDMAKSIARRAERRFRKAAGRYTADKKAMVFMNRLSDYLYMEARFADWQSETDPTEGFRQEIIRKLLKDMELMEK